METQKSIKFFFIFLLYLLLFIGSTTVSIGQEKPEQRPDLGQPVEVENVLKEEIHRYMGYERLLPKYLSLPYDVSMNTNVRGAFIDISYLILLFLPLLLLVSLRDIRLKMVVLFLLLLFLIISLPTGYAAFYNIGVSQLDSHLQGQIAITNFSAAPLVFLKLKITQLFSYLYISLDHFIAPLSGEGDYITLALLPMLLVLVVALMKERWEYSKNVAINLIPFFLLYGFLWLILGAGIAWYGLLLIAGGLIVSMIFLRNLLKDRIRQILAWGSIGVWLWLALFMKFSNYMPSNSNPNPNLNLGAINVASLVYGTGKYSKEQVRQLLYADYGTALKEINGDPTALVYRVGTFFHYFVEGNNNRVFEDNQLGFFNTLTGFFPEKEDLTNAFKANNYRYFIIDLNTATIDSTPDKSLTAKFQKCLDFLNNNPKLQLVATDRKMSNGKVVKNGSFVVFKII